MGSNLIFQTLIELELRFFGIEPSAWSELRFFPPLVGIFSCPPFCLAFTDYFVNMYYVHNSRNIACKSAFFLLTKMTWLVIFHTIFKKNWYDSTWKKIRYNKFKKLCEYVEILPGFKNRGKKAELKNVLQSVTSMLGVPTLKTISSDLAGWYIFLTISRNNFKSVTFIKIGPCPTTNKLLPGLVAQFCWAGLLGRACALRGFVWWNNQEGYSCKSWKTKTLRFLCQNSWPVFTLNQCISIKYSKNASRL